MKLKNILVDLDYEIDTGLGQVDLENIEIKDISYNSKQAGENSIFVALVGKTVDGHKFIGDAYKKGSRVFLVNKDFTERDYGDAIYIRVENTRSGLSKISSNFFGDPSSRMTIIGITGTKGKTTSSNYLKKILEDRGYSTGIIGTNGVFYKGKVENTNNTTPESYEIHRIFQDMYLEGVEYVVMEVSSGGLMMNRVDDVKFNIGVFTNISEDHIGPKEHPDFEHYLKSKMKLFDLCQSALINVDDQYSNKIIELLEEKKLETRTFSIDSKDGDFKADNVEISKDIDHLGVKFDLYKDKSLVDEFIIPSPGKFTVYNALTVIGISYLLDIGLESVRQSLRDARVDGRVEVLDTSSDFKVILDYAHNKDSLRNVLDTLKMYEPKRLICLIGSVGGRSIARRYEIGQVISTKCDLAILTEDNPDYEDPLEIIKDIKKGYVKDIETIIEPDRTKAIKKAISILEKGDILLLAGRGHESYQMINGEKHRHSDRDVVRKILG